MEISRKRVRKDFCPLTISVTLSCATDASSPMLQAYNAYDKEYEPNRQLSPCIIRPVVSANANDGSWKDMLANRLLVNMKWFANGVNISELSEWSGKYVIESDGDFRGSLQISLNCPPGKNISMHFEADLPDIRLGLSHHIISESIVLSTIDKSSDGYSISIGDDKSIKYNPFLDKLHTYEYKVSHGMANFDINVLESYKDSNCYLRTIPIEVYRGGLLLNSSEYSVKLYRIISSTNLTELTGDNEEIISVSSSEIVLDLRMISKANYMIKAFANVENHGNTELKEVAKVQFSVSREYQKFRCTPTNEASISPDQFQRHDEVYAESEGKILDCPESIIKIVWFTDTANKQALRHNEGRKTVFTLKDTGIGNTYADDWLETYVTAEQKGAMMVATDTSGNVYTDEFGNEYIIN